MTDDLIDCYKKNKKPFKALIYACDQDPFTTFNEQIFWEEVKGVEFIEFGRRDVVRHPVVSSIIKAYDEAKEKKQLTDR